MLDFPTVESPNITTWQPSHSSAPRELRCISYTTQNITHDCFTLYFLSAWIAIVESPKRVDGQGFTAFPTTRRRTHYEHTAPTRFQITTWLRHAVTFDGPSVAAKACGTRAQSCQEIHLYTTSRVGGSHSFGGEFSGCCHRRDQRRQELPHKRSLESTRVEDSTAPHWGPRCVPPVSPRRRRDAPSDDSRCC